MTERLHIQRMRSGGVLGAAVLAVVCAGLVACGCNIVVPQRQDEYVDGRLRITYWEKWTGQEGEAIRKVVDRFNAIQDRLYVDLITMSQIDQKALVAIAGGDPPDVVGLWSAGMPAFAEKNALMPLSPFMERAGMRKEDFIPVFLELNTYEGELYGLPTTPATVALHWNKKAFREAGLDPERPPRTFEELMEMADTLTKIDENGHIVQLGFTPSEPNWWPWAWTFWFGGKLFDGERITFDSPENLAAFKWIQSFSQRYGTEELRRFQGGIGENFQSPLNPFFTGKVAMEIQGVWMANMIEQFAPDLEWGAAPFPAAVAGLENAAVAECDSICIPTGAPHPEEAFEFIRFACSQEGLEILNMAQRKFTPLKKASEEFMRTHPHPYLPLFIELAESPHVFHPPLISVWFEYQDECRAAFDMVVFGLETPENAVARVQRTMTETWERTKARMERRKAAEQEQAP